ncbi:MAG: polyphenol oxidase family protein, partial [Alphaproteobacteria bacterium]
GLVGEADALWTQQKNLWLAIKTADCVPLLIATPTVVAAVHCGWKGMKANLLGITLHTLAEHGANMADAQVHIGPHICAHCYQVGREFLGYFDAAFFMEKADGLYLNLAAVAHAQAVAAGVPATNIRPATSCTLCGTGYHSHRRNGTKARNMSYMRLT